MSHRDCLNRRTFLQSCAIAGAVSTTASAEPKYKVVSAYKAIQGQGMPGKYPGHVIDVHSQECVDESTERINASAVQRMMTAGMLALTGEKELAQAWAHFIQKDDVVGIKVNCVGRPHVISSPEVVAEVVRNVHNLGVPLSNICIYERFEDQMDECQYPKTVPQGVKYFGAEKARGSNLSYDPAMYVEVDFFDEDDTRSNIIRPVSKSFTKIINIPNIKDHGASGITGCLKNIAYGSFSNVARSHSGSVTHTRTFIGTLAATEPVRSRTVLQIVDGVKGVWHGGPFAEIKEFRFFPKQIMFGTDPVALDRLILNIVDDYRKSKNAVSVRNRDPKYLRTTSSPKGPNPNLNPFVREPGHIDYAAELGLGIADLAKIQTNRIDLE